jgi:hypothetical protein
MVGDGRVTATWQLFSLPSWPQYCRVTRPNVAPSWEPRIVDDPGLDRSAPFDNASTSSRTLASTRSSDQGALPTKCSSDGAEPTLTESGRSKAASSKEVPSRYSAFEGTRSWPKMVAESGWRGMWRRGSG